MVRSTGNLSSIDKWHIPEIPHVPNTQTHGRVAVLVSATRVAAALQWPVTPDGRERVNDID